MSLQIWAELGDPVGSFKGCKKRNGSGSPKIKVARSPIDLIFDVKNEKDGPEAPKFKCAVVSAELHPWEA